MFNKLKQSAKSSGASKFFKSVVLTGGMLLFVLKPAFSSNSAEVKAELMQILKTVPVKERKMVEPNQTVEKTAKFETLGGNDTLKDPYDQIREYVSPTDTAYFNQLKKHMETKESNEQIKCKAVVYAILQDTALNQEQRQTLALAYFERLAKMPGSNYRFRLAGNKKYETNTIYADRRNRYSGYKSYLDVLALDEEIAKLDKDIQKEKEKQQQLDEQSKQLDEQSKQLDEQSKQLDEQSKQLDREIQLLEKLLNTYKQK